MKITIASTKETCYTKSLLNTAKNKDVSIQTQNISCISDLSNTGDIIYWQSSSAENDYPTIAQKSHFLLEAQKSGKIIVNEAFIANSFLSHRAYQQSFVKKTFSKIDTIPTFIATTIEDLYELINNNTLTFPFIAKLDYVSQESDIIFVNSYDDIKNIKFISKYIFQKFIPNDGDYRIYIIGGVAIEIIKRTSSNKSFLNNISQGCTIQRISDIKTREMLAIIATRITAAMKLSICSLDIIQNADNGQYYFLEVNTIAQWKELQSVSTINIAQCIIKHLTTIAPQVKQRDMTYSIIEDYYDKNIKYLSRETQFHFYSRMYLTTSDIKYFKILQQLKPWYVWDANTLQDSIKNLFKNSANDIKSVINNKNFRIPETKKYPLLGTYNKILYKTLFTKTIYGTDYKKEIVTLLQNRDIIEYKKSLMNDDRAIFALSTHAINFIYLSSWLFEDENIIDVKKLFIIAQNEKLPDEHTTRLSYIYFLTHCIICESLFYSRKISQHQSTYLKMIKELESVIIAQYTNISLDQKCEFLVCAKMLEYKTDLQETINNEVASSFSPLGNYIVNTYNTYKNSIQKDLDLSEHSNVLYLLSK